MEFKKCTRCGNFYVSEGNVCPRCTAKDNMNFQHLKHIFKKMDLKEV